MARSVGLQPAWAASSEPLCRATTVWASHRACSAPYYPLLADVGGVVAKQYGVKRALDFLKVKRTTFVITPDRRIKDVITSEMNMNAHADRALAALAAN